MGKNKLDCAVVSINKQNSIKVLSSGGDNRFGGEQFNQPLIKLLYENFLNDGGSDFLKKKPKEKFNFLSSIEMAKRNLTFMKETEINLPKIDGENDIIQSLTREDFDKLNEKNYEHVLECIDVKLNESINNLLPILELMIYPFNVSEKIKYDLIDRSIITENTVFEYFSLIKSLVNKNNYILSLNFIESMSIFISKFPSEIFSEKILIIMFEISLLIFNKTQNIEIIQQINNFLNFSEFNLLLTCAE